jgi:hypothetical protein
MGNGRDQNGDELKASGDAIEYIAAKTKDRVMFRRQELAGVHKLLDLPSVGGRAVYPREDLDRIVALLNGEDIPEPEEEDDLDGDEVLDDEDLDRDEDLEGEDD